MKTELATIKDIRRLVPKIKDSFSLCNFLGKTEKEVLVAQTIHACKINHKKRGICFSFDGVEGQSTLCQNISSLEALIEDGLFVRGKFKSKPVLYPTKLLVLMLDAFFAKKN